MLELLDGPAETVLPPDANKWGDVVVKTLMAGFPGLRGKIERVEFPRIDKTTGTALGYALLGNKCRVPVVVSRYKMSPLDLYIDGKTMLPLNERTIKYLESGSWPFRQVSDKGRWQLSKTGSHRTYPQGFLESSRGTLVKIASVHPELLRGVAPHGAYDRKVNVCAITVNPGNALPVTIATLEKEASCSMSEFASQFGGKLLRQAMRRGYVILSDLPAYTKLENVAPAPPPQIPTKNWGRFLVDGVEHRGVQFVVFCPGREGEWPPRVVLTSDGRYIHDCVTFYVTQVDESKPDISGHTPSIGEDFFIKHHDLVVGPYTLLSVDRLEGQLSYVARPNGFFTDGVVAIKPVAGLKCLQSINDGAVILIPDHYQLLGMKRIDGRGHRNIDPIEKTAATTIVLRFAPDGTFHIDDKGVTGLDQHMLTGATKTKALMVLARAGLSPADAERIVQQAQATGAADFAWQGPPQKTASEGDAEAAEEIARLATEGGLLKAALDIGQLDPTSVDQALELHAVTPETVRRLSLLSGGFAQTLERLCQALFLKRMNRNEVKLDEQRLKSAIDALDAIISRLNVLAP